MIVLCSVVSFSPSSLAWDFKYSVSEPYTPAAMINLAITELTPTETYIKWDRIIQSNITSEMKKTGKCYLKYLRNPDYFGAVGPGNPTSLITTLDKDCRHLTNQDGLDQVYCGQN